METTDPYHTTNDKYIALDIDGDNVIVAICLHSWNVSITSYHSAELVFVDAGENTDMHNMRVFLLMTYSVAGVS